MSVKISFQASLGYTEWPVADVITSLKGLGYDGIEWGTTHFDPEKGLAACRNVVDATREAGLEVCRIFAHEDLVSLDDAERKARIDRTVAVIEMAGECGASNVGAMSGPAPWDPASPKIPTDISEGAAWDQVLDAYRQFEAAGRKAGVKISSEGVFGMVAHDLYSHKFLIDTIDSEFVGVNYDPSHGVLSGDFDVAWNIRQWGDRIIHCHLKDAVGISQRPGEFIFPLLGEGRVDWSAFFNTLDEIGFDGYAAVEFESFTYLAGVLHGDPEAAARISMEQVNALRSAAADPEAGHRK
jgi:sugar phosphate isomerase/epimerase